MSYDDSEIIYMYVRIYACIYTHLYKRVCVCVFMNHTHTYVQMQVKKNEAAAHLAQNELL